MNEGLCMLIAIVLGIGEPLIICWIISIQEDLEFRKSVNKNTRDTNGKE